MKRYCLALDLKDDATLIEEYKQHHRAGWPEIKQSIVSSGIVDMQIYIIGNRLFMIMDTEDDFSFARKAQMDAANPAVQEWESLMARFQDVGAEDDPSAKWRVMAKIFQLP